MAGALDVQGEVTDRQWNEFCRAVKRSYTPTPRRTIIRLSPKESATLEALERRYGLSYREIARVATRLFGRPIAASTVQQHLRFKARRQERELEQRLRRDAGLFAEGV